jgi:hypothetical protein
MLELGESSATENILYARRVRGIVKKQTQDWREIDGILATEQG